jgi:hypothetical protein
MVTRKPAASKDRRDIGQVSFLAEEMHLARGLTSCCVGVEALLETRSGSDMLRKELAKRGITGLTQWLRGL